MTDFIFVYTTAPSRAEADRIARALVEEKLAACASIIPDMESVYRWQGKVEIAREVVLHIDTRADLFDKVAARIKELHSYECPCIVALPFVAGTKDFLDWIQESTEQ